MIRHFESGVVVEKVGDNFLVLSQENGVAHSFPLSFQQPIDALISGKDVSAFKEEIRMLDQLGLLNPEEKLMPSRRQAVAGFTGILGAGVATIALPTAAFASSATFFVNNTTFQWDDGDVNSDPGFVVGSVVPLDASIFALGSSWTITVDTGTDIGTATATVQETIAPERDLLFDFPGAPLSPGTGLVLLGRLSGPGGLTSNQFQITEL